MDRTPLVKLLLISALSAGLVMPLFFYSRGLMRQAEQAMEAAQSTQAAETPSPSAETHDNQASDHGPSDSDTAKGHADAATAHSDGAAHAPSERPDAAPTAMAQASATPADGTAAAKAEKSNDATDADPGAQVYKPPLFGSCKRMFQQLQKQEVAEGEYKAFAFAFDGKTANCAEYVSNKSLRHARAVVLKNCQEDRAAGKRYVACLLYEVQ